VSVVEKTWLTVNGTRQGMFVAGGETRKPVLLFLHGGPGMPEYFMERTHPTGLHDDFVVCWWEQRGAGLSFAAGRDARSMTVEQLVDDTIAVTELLRVRYSVERVFLLAHSWGSFLGIQAAARAPHLYHAYIGMGQVAYQLRSERLAYEYMLEEYGRRGDRRMVRRLSEAPVTLDGGVPPRYLAVRDAAMHGLGVGTTRQMRSVVTGIFVPVWRTGEYTLRERADIWRGKARSRRLLWDTFLTTDLTARVTELDLPVYVCQGTHDLTASYGEARSYFQRIAAPVKGFYTFAESAHSPLFEEPLKMRRVLGEDVLAGAVALADRWA
jgi:pimeloyl-ACP methyl ester carboxylesterase